MVCACVGLIFGRFLLGIVTGGPSSLYRDFIEFSCPLILAPIFYQKKAVLRPERPRSRLVDVKTLHVRRDSRHFTAFLGIIARPRYFWPVRDTPPFQPPSSAPHFYLLKRRAYHHPHSSLEFGIGIDHHRVQNSFIFCNADH